MSEERKDLVITDDLKPILEVLKEEDAGAIVELRDELGDNWRKKQIFRTETEMRNTGNLFVKWALCLMLLWV